MGAGGDEGHDPEGQEGLSSRAEGGAACERPHGRLLNTDATKRLFRGTLSSIFGYCCTPLRLS